MTHPLLEGPRGRHLCTVSIAHRDPEVWNTWLRAAWAPGDAARLEAFVGALRAASLVHDVPLEDLASTVDDAAYWQPPRDTDDVLRDPRVLAVLEPAAEAVAAASAGSWWSTPIGAEQAVVRWDGAPEPLGATAAVADWTARVQSDERLRAPSGAWWSTPAFGPATSRPVDGLPAVGLALVEDSSGWERARVQRVATAGARVFEIDGPGAWLELVARYRIEVTHARRREWEWVTRLDSRWFLPDWSLAAADFDAVHLSVDAYLRIAGRALPVPEGHTLVAGWSPDWTYWLTDAFVRLGEPEEWVRTNDEHAWAPATG